MIALIGITLSSVVFGDHSLREISGFPMAETLFLLIINGMASTLATLKWINKGDA